MRAFQLLGISTLNCSKPSGYFMYHQVNIQKFYIILT